MEAGRGAVEERTPRELSQPEKMVEMTHKMEKRWGWRLSFEVQPTGWCRGLKLDMTPSTSETKNIFINDQNGQWIHE